MKKLETIQKKEKLNDTYVLDEEEPFSSEYSKKALEHIEKALYWLNKGVEDRIERNILEEYKK